MWKNATTIGLNIMGLFKQKSLSQTICPLPAVSIFVSICVSYSVFPGYVGEYILRTVNSLYLVLHLYKVKDKVVKASNKDSARILQIRIHGFIQGLAV